MSQNLHTSEHQPEYNELRAPDQSSPLMVKERRLITKLSTSFMRLIGDQELYEMNLAKWQKFDEEGAFRQFVARGQIHLERCRFALKIMLKSRTNRTLLGKDDDEKIELLVDENAELRCTQLVHEQKTIEQCTNIRQLESKLANSKEAANALSSQLEAQKLIVTCSICLEARFSTVFQCGHLSCDDCSDRLSQCHICRQLILQRMRIFF